MNHKKTTLLALAAGLGLAGPAHAQLFNEFRSNPPGTDSAPEFVELTGTPGSSFTGEFLALENDSGGGFGEIQDLTSISDSFDSNGLLTFDSGDIENPSYTLALVGGFTGSDGDDLDTNDDGTIDVTPWTTVFDSISILDAASDTGNAASLGGTEIAFNVNNEPELVFRDSVTEDWYGVGTIGDNTKIEDSSGTAVAASAFDFDPSTGNTFGAVNATTAVPEPSTYALLVGLFSLTLVAFRRRRA